MLWVCANPRRVVLWEAYYLRWDPSLWPVAVVSGDAELLVSKQEGASATAVSDPDEFDEEEAEEFDDLDFESLGPMAQEEEGQEEGKGLASGTLRAQLSSSSADRLVF